MPTSSASTSTMSATPTRGCGRATCGAARSSARMGSRLSGAYPANREADVVLRDGSTVSLRPVRPGDQKRLFEFFESLDLESRSLRFFSGGAALDRSAERMANVDYAESYGLLATRGAEERLVGHGLYVGCGAGRAEVAFVVAEEMQGRGLGTILLAHLAEVAAEHGVETLVAEILPQNHRMVEMFRASGFPLEVRSVDGCLRVELPTSLSEQAVSRFQDRDRGHRRL